MKVYLSIALLACLLAIPHGASTVNEKPAIAGLPRSSPEEQGVSSSAIASFIEAADKNIDSLHSIMVLRHGQVIAEGWWAPYAPQSPHILFSLSKSFTSTAVGLAIAEGKFSIDDEVLKFFPEDAPAEPGTHLKAMRVRDLLRMNTGHETEPRMQQEKLWKKTFLNHPVRFKPGTHFLYNTPATYMLSAIVEKTTGMPLLDYLRPRIFDPLGIQNPTWDKSPEGITLGGYGLSIRTEDIARFGQLYLQKGQWQGKQLIPVAWVDEATSFQTSNGSNPNSDWDQGYGYQFWRSRNGAYRGDGAFGQYCIVLPKQDVVIAITGGLRDMQSVMNLVWEKLLPGIKDSKLSNDSASLDKLKLTLKNLSLRLPEGGGQTETTNKVIGHKYLFSDNPRKLESIKIESITPAITTFTTQFNKHEERVECGHNTWIKGQVVFNLPTRQPIAASCTWTAPDTFTAKIVLYETPFIYTINVKFADNEVRYNSNMNVGFGPTTEPELTGKR